MKESCLRFVLAAIVFFSSTNLKANFRASEIIELVKIRATYKVAFIKRFIICVNFLTFSAALGIVQVNLPSALACTKIREIRGQKI